MKCIFCKQPAGFMSRYHNDCHQKVESIIQKIETMINDYKDSDVVPKDAKQQLKELANSSILYKNYMTSKLFDQTTIYTSEVIIHMTLKSPNLKIAVKWLKPDLDMKSGPLGRKKNIYWITLVP